MDIKSLGLDKKYNALKKERDKKIELWKEISEFIAPNMGWFDNENPNSENRRGEEIFDSTVRRALSTLQAGMQGGLTSPSKSWLQISISDPNLAHHPDVMLWADEVTNILISIFSQSNIYNRLHGAYGEVAAFGTAALYIEEDQARIINSRLLTAGEYVASFDAIGLPNAFGREFWMSGLDMEMNFGKNNIPEKIRSANENGREHQWWKIYQLIAEDNIGYPDRQLTRFPFYSIYWCDEQDEHLLLSGYEEFPVLIPRWDVIGNDYYGYGPGEMALPESKTLQTMRLHFFEADELSIKPPVVMHQNLIAERIQIRPGGVYPVSDINHGAKALYQVQPNFDGHLHAITDSRRLIEQIFFADLFLMLASMEADRGVMTATEVSVRQQEKMQLLGPVVERLEYELLNPLIHRTYMIAMRRGLIPTPPEIIYGQDIRIEYVSMLAIAQKASSFSGINDLLALTAGLAGIDQYVVDKINGDEIIDQFARISGIPASVINRPEVVAMIREQRQQAMQQQQEMEQMQQMAQMAQSGGAGMKDIAQADAMLGGMQQ